MESIKVYYAKLNIESAGNARGTTAGSASAPFFHKYVVYTDSSGNQFAARGGPSFKKSSFGDIETVVDEFDPDFPDYPPAGETHPGETIAEDTDLSAEWQDIVDAMGAINDAELTYLPERNSNSAVDTALDAAGLPEPTLDGPGDYNSPGSGNILPTTNDENQDSDSDGRDDGPGGDGEAGGSGDGTGGEDGDGGQAPLPPRKPEVPDNQGSPLVLDLDGDGIELTALGDYGTYFDIENDGRSYLTGWVDIDDGLLAIDLNSDGEINDITELFGDADTDGFTELGLYDTNSDGIIDTNDADFADLLIWKDANSDGVSQAGELQSLSSYNIASISLDADRLANTEIEGNSITHQASYKLTDGTERDIVDAWFNYSTFYTHRSSEVDFDARTLFMPSLRGFGDLDDLHITMSEDNGTGASTLMEQVLDFIDNYNSTDVFADWDNITSDFENILLRWAGVDTVSSTSRGSHVDARHLEFYEAFRGEEFSQAGNSNPGVEAGAFVEGIFDYLTTFYSIQIVNQIIGNEIFEGSYYSLYTAGFQGDLDLTQSGIDAIEALASDVNNDATEVWTHFAQFLGYSKGHSNLTAAEITALDTAVANTSEPGLSDWQDVVSVMTANLGGLILDETDWGSFEVFYDGYTNGTSGDDTITDTSPDATSISGGDGNDTIYGQANHDRLFGNDGNDTLEGGAGDDYLIGGLGDDVYVFETGNDTFSEAINGGGTDEIQVLASTGLTTTNITDLYRIGSDLLITFDNNDYITIAGFSETDAAIEKIVFDFDSSEIDIVNLVEQKHYGTDRADKLDLTADNFQTLKVYGYDGNDTIEATTAQADFYGGDGYDALIGDYQDDTLRGEADGDILIGNGGADTLYGGTGDDTLDGGAGNDTLYTGEGNDTVIFGRTYGDDTVYTESNHHSVLKFTSDVATTDILLNRGSNVNDLIVEISDTNETIFLDNMFNYSQFAGWRYEFSEFKFDDGTVWSAQDVRDNHISQNTTSGDDVTQGFDVDDSFVSSAGNDVFYGYEGDDDYDWTANAGNDTIMDNGADAQTDYDEVTLTGINSTDVTIARSVDLDDLIITNTITSETLTIDYEFGNRYDVIDLYSFADSVTWTATDVELALIAQNITSGADTTHGYEDNNDVFAGSAGDDLIYGYTGTDTYNWGAGDGSDTIFEKDSDTDIVNLTGLNITDITVSRSVDLDDLILINDSTSETLTVDRHFDGTNGYYSINTFNFANSDVWNPSDIISAYLAENTTSGDDVTYGFDGDDSFASSAGDDQIYGQKGDDEYFWGTGSGDDYVEERLALSSTDEVTFEGLNAADVTFARTAGNDNLIIVNNGSEETLTIYRQFYTSSYQIDSFNFADASSWSKSTVETNSTDNLAGTSGADTLTGDSAANIIFGLEGDDVITGGTGDDTLFGGSGSDEYVYNAGDGEDTINDLDGTTDFIQLGTGIVEADLTLTQVGNNLEITFAGTSTDKITIIDHYDSSGTKQVEKVVFDDASELDLVGPNVITGTTASETITGTSGDDIIAGLEGDDTIDGGVGIDTVDYSASTSAVNVYLHQNTASGGHGNDSISNVENIIGSDYNDTLVGVADTTEIYGGAGNDALWASSSTTGATLYGEDGNDNFYGSNNADTLYGGAGNDVLRGYHGNDTFYGGDGNDTFYGMYGDNIYVGGWGRDSFFNTNGNNTYYDVELVDGAVDITGGSETTSSEYFRGGIGDDTFISQVGKNVLQGKDGDDTYKVYLHSDNSGNTIDISSETSGYDELYITEIDYTGTDWFFRHSGSTNMELVYTGTTTDTIIRLYDQQQGYDGSGNALFAIDKFYFAGTDTLDFSNYVSIAGTNATETHNGTSGYDYIVTAGGNDTVNAGDGGDFVRGGYGNDTIHGDAGDDFLLGYTGQDTIYGGDGVDNINGEGGDDTLYGGDGNDVIWGEGGSDTIHGGAGNDTLNGGGGSPTSPDHEIIYGDEGHDTINTSTGVGETSTAYGDGDGSETYTGGNDVMYGGSGVDTFYGGGGNDTLGGYAGDDILYGGDGNDSISGERYGNTSWNGNDTLYGEAGADSLYGNNGDDTLYGGDGVDQLWGNSGADTFVFEAATAFSGVDAIRDFSTSDSDVIDIADVLSAHYDPVSDAITDFVQITDNGTDSFIAVDADGGADNFVQIAEVKGVTGLTDEAVLEANGTLITS